MTQTPPPAALAPRPPRPRKKPAKAPPAVPYEFAEPRGWADKVAHLEQLPVGTDVALIGKCPRCTHEISAELPLRPQTVVVRKARRDEEAAAAPSPVEVRRPPRVPKNAPTYSKVARCNCGMAHTDRPEGISSGCGAFGLLEVWVR
jgi:hypothetical protein